MMGRIKVQVKAGIRFVGCWSPFPMAGGLQAAFLRAGVASCTPRTRHPRDFAASCSRRRRASRGGAIGSGAGDASPGMGHRDGCLPFLELQKGFAKLISEVYLKYQEMACFCQQGFLAPICLTAMFTDYLPGRMESFSLAKEFMFWSGGNEENFSTVSALETSFLKLPKFSFAVP